MMIKFLLFLSSFVLNAIADDFLVRITNSMPDSKNSVTILNVRTQSNGTLSKLVAEDRDLVTGKVTSVTIFDHAEIKKGVVLVSSKHPVSGAQLEVFKLSSPTLNLKDGGKLNIRFLRDGFMNHYGEVGFELLDKAGNWSLFEENGANIDHLHLEPNYGFLVGLVGIKDIVVQ